MQTTTAGMVAAMNAYGLSAEQAGFASDVYANTMLNGVGTMDQFVGAMNPILGIMSEAGVGLDEVGANMAFMTQGGVNASQSATQLRAAVSAILKPNKEMSAALQELGFESGAAFLEARGLQGGLEDLTSVTGGVEGTLSEAMGSVQGLNAALRLGTVDARVFGIDFRQNVLGTTDEMANIQLQSAGAQFDILKSNLQVLAATIGGAVLPVLVDLAQQAVPIVQAFADWAAVNGDIIRDLFLMTGAALAIGIGFKALALMTGPLSAGFGLVSLALRGAAIAFGLLSSPILAGIGLGVALWLAWQNNFLGIRDIVERMVEAVKTAFDDVKTKFEEVIQWITTNVDFSGVLESVTSVF